MNKTTQPIFDAASWRHRGKKIGIMMALGCLTSIANAGGMTCANASLANYIALGSTGCTIGGLQVSNFSFSAVYTGPSSTPGDNFNVFVGTNGIIFGGTTIFFDATYSLTSQSVAQTLTVSFGYDVALVTPGVNFTRFGLGGHTGDDGASATAYITALPCGTISTGGSGPFVDCGIGGSSMHVTNTIHIQTDAISGSRQADTAFAQSVRNEILATPEPATSALAVFGISLIALKRRLKQR